MTDAVHWSDCATHSGPAEWPMPCDCALFAGRESPFQAFRHLWRMRWTWKQENNATAWQFVGAVLTRGRC